MTETNGSKIMIARTERGLTITGTRITVYDVMDYLKADWPTHLIQNWLGLTEQQMQAVLAYITAHKSEVEADYSLLLRQSQEIRAYWEERNREKLAQIAQLPAPPGKEELWRKIQKKKAELGMA